MAAPRKAQAKPDGEAKSTGTRPIVTAPIVSVRTKGDTIKHLYKGDVVTDDVTPASLENLRSLGYVTDGDASEPEADGE